MSVFKFGRRNKSSLSNSQPPDRRSAEFMTVRLAGNTADESTESIAVSTRGPSSPVPPPPTQATEPSAESPRRPRTSLGGTENSRVGEVVANPSDRRASRACGARRRISLESVTKWWRQIKCVGNCLQKIGDDLDRSSLKPRGSRPTAKK